MWIARNKSGTLVLWFNKPVRQGEEWYSNDGFFILDSVQFPTFGEVTLFPEVTWEDSPKKVKFELVEEDFVEKACEWLGETLYIHTEETEDKHWNETKTFDWVTSDYDSVKDFIEAFRKAMKNPSKN